MNLSQDEINSLMTGNPSDDSDDSVDIMSPEAIAAMLDSVADGATAGDTAPADDDSVDIMSPEAIAAMLDNVANAATAGEAAPAGDDSVEIMSPEAIAALLDSSFGEPGDDSGQEEALNKEGMLTNEEIDILGEIGNISMGAVATTMYSLLDRRVSITTPRVRVYEAKDVLAIYRVPFVVATIEYVQGITGRNLLVLKVEDAAIITDILMGGDGQVSQPIELNEMHLSAMSEIMNQMMGASSTSLSKLLLTAINISPPISTQVDVGFDISSLLGDTELITKISFDMEIEGLLKSELIQLVPYEASRLFAKQFIDVGMGTDSKPSAPEVPPARPAPAPSAPPPAPAFAPPPPQPPPPATPPPPPPAPVPPAMEAAPPPAQYQQPYPQEPYPQGSPYPQPYPQSPYMQAYPPQPAAYGHLVDVHPMQFQPFDAPGPVGEAKGMDLVYNIPLQVTVELGKSKKEISEILEFSTGTIVVLDKLAGDPVEIVVNGKLIARGEVVVIDDNYGVRITDIING